MSVVTEDRLQGFKEKFNLPALPPTTGRIDNLQMHGRGTSLTERTLEQVGR